MYFLLILSHKKSTVREEQRQRILANNNGKFIFYYFIGDEKLPTPYEVDETNNIVYLKVADNYESLSMKTYLAMEFIAENYLDKVSGVFKTDDDINLNIDKIFDCINTNKSSLYFGLVAENPIDYNSTYHYDKCQSKKLEKPILIPRSIYCAGGGYYVSKAVINNILANKKIFKDIMFEDVSVGLSMNKYGILPTSVNIKDNGCMWGENTAAFEPLKDDSSVITFQMPNRNIDACKCGEPKNRRASNFCQKCNRLY